VFFFQAEDGIRDFHVTGVQTCALPIWPMATAAVRARTRIRRLLTGVGDASGLGTLARERVGAEAHVVGDARGAHDEAGLLVELRSEERRVGKEWRARWAPDHGKEEWRR